MFSDDSFKKMFSDRAEFLNFADKVAYQRRVYNVALGNLVLAPLAYAPNSALKAEVLKDTSENTGLYALFHEVDGDEEYAAIGSSALKSIAERVLERGNGMLWDVPRDDACNYIRACFNVKASTQAKVVVSGDKIRAVLSNSYKQMPAERLLRIVESRIKDLSPKFESGSIDHEYTTATWSLKPGEIPAIKGLCEGADDVTAYLTFSTSDIGLASAAVTPFVKFKSLSAPCYLGDPQKTEHSGEFAMESFSNAMDVAIGSFRNGLEKIKALNETVILTPVTTLKRAFKKLKLPLKKARELVDEFEVLHTFDDPEAEIYASELYSCVMELLSTMESGKPFATNTRLCGVAAQVLEPAFWRELDGLAPIDL